MVKRIILHQSHLTEVILMLLAMGPAMASLAASMATGDGEWFQRSGSLMVLFSAAVEYRRRHLRENGRTDNSWLFWRRIPYICYSAIFVGTLIWGYGDLLFA